MGTNAGNKISFTYWQQPREGRLMQDLIVGLIYLGAVLSVIAYVFSVPDTKREPGLTYRRTRSWATKASRSRRFKNAPQRPGAEMHQKRRFVAVSGARQTRGSLLTPGARPRFLSEVNN
jgi:hypothetical protein